MLATLIIVFREAFEAGLIVGIVLAATHGVPGRGLQVAAGVAAGVAGAVVAALFAGSVADAFDGAGQDILNAAILGVAVTMLVWHVVWMSSHGREMATELRRVSGDVGRGGRPVSALSVVVGAAVLREGFEIVLFLYGIAVGGGASAPTMLAGGAAGLALAASLTALTYAGLVQIPAHRLFGVTEWLVTLLACGLAAQAIGCLQQGGVVPMGPALWDSSASLPMASLPGRLAHSLVGYTDRPTAPEALAYVATFAVIRLLRTRRSAVYVG